MREIRLSEKCEIWLDNSPVPPGVFTSFSEQFAPFTNQHFITLKTAEGDQLTVDPEEASVYMKYSPTFFPRRSNRTSSDKSVLTNSSVWKEVKPVKPNEDKVDKLFSPKADWIKKWNDLMDKKPQTKGSDDFEFTTRFNSGEPLSEIVKKLELKQEGIPIKYESPQRQVIALCHNFRTKQLIVYYQNQDNNICYDCFLSENSGLNIEFR